MVILGIESSCDETSIAILEIDESDSNGKINILSNKISSQIDIHREYGGVVPEIASRHHVRNIASIVAEACAEAGKTLDDVDYIAVTYAPGLIGALLVGISFAKGLSFGHNIPIIPVHHLKGHVFANWIEHDVQLPCIALVVSGGHTNIVKIGEDYNFQNIGETLDDAIGESFDKVARAIGLPYPGGPLIDKMYYEGNKDFLPLPEPKVGKYEFSFSGLKTAVINYVNKAKMKGESYKQEDIAASYLDKAVEILVKKTVSAAEEYHAKSIILAGGVAANSLLRTKLAEVAKSCLGLDVHYPSMKLCTDNAAMIAAAAYYKLINARAHNNPDSDIFAPDNLNGLASLQMTADMY